MDTPSYFRPFGLAAGPLTVVALGLMLAAAATAGDAVDSSPLAVASSAVLLLALLSLGVVGLSALSGLRAAGRGASAPALAVVGTVLVAGGNWASLFLLPDLASKAPALLTSGALTGVMVGYTASYAVFAVGWAATGIALVRPHAVPAWVGVLMAVGGVASMVPAPEAMRLLIVSIAASVAVRRLTVPASEGPRELSTAH